jgi:hypothetical protein
MGRKALLTVDDAVAVSGATAASKLQADSERRAVVQFVIDEGGRATIDSINRRFGYDTRTVVGRLIHIGWLERIAA